MPVLLASCCCDTAGPCPTCAGCPARYRFTVDGFVAEGYFGDPGDPSAWTDRVTQLAPATADALIQAGPVPVCDWRREPGTSPAVAMRWEVNGGGTSEEDALTLDPGILCAVWSAGASCAGGGGPSVGDSIWSYAWRMLMNMQLFGLGGFWDVVNYGYRPVATPFLDCPATGAPTDCLQVPPVQASGFFGFPVRIVSPGTVTVVEL